MRMGIELFENLHLNENCELQFFLNLGMNGNWNGN